MAIFDNGKTHWDEVLSASWPEMTSFQSADKMSIKLNWDVIVLGYLWEDMVGCGDVIFAMCQDMKPIWTHLEAEIDFWC